MKVLLTVAIIVAMCILPQAADAKCPVIGDFDFNTVPTLSTKLTQKFFNASVEMDYVINLCKPVQEPFGQASPCKAAGFVNEYTNTSCKMYFDVIAGGYSNGTCATLNYINSATYNTAWVQLVCGATLALRPLGDVFVQTTPDGKFEFTFTFQTSAACATPLAGPPPLLSRSQKKN